MKEIFLSQNIKLIFPFCCEINAGEVNFPQQISQTIQTIKITEIGKQLLKDIAEGPHPILISTHSLQEGCTDSTTLAQTNANDRENAADPTKGSGSTIYIHPQFSSIPNRFWTERHRFCCVSLGLVSKACWDANSGCAQRVDLPRVLFHELVHAYHNQQGTNQGSKRDVPPIYKNREELSAIQLENEFARQLRSKLQKSEEEIPDRYGHSSPDSPQEQKVKARAYWPEQVRFLRTTTIETIQRFGQYFAEARQRFEEKKEQLTIRVVTQYQALRTAAVNTIQGLAQRLINGVRQQVQEITNTQQSLVDKNADLYEV